ncbi:MAG: cell envelope integrity protein TolA [Xanthomonadales bacterium]|nr:cell envelope integrity protein TolA [Xanthomonadales bacterium]
MSESAGNLRALALSLLIHLLCVAVIAIGLFWTRTEAPLSVAGSVIEATLVTSQPLPARPPDAPRRPPQPTPEAPKPQPKPTPAPQKAETPPQPTPQAPVQQPDTRETEKAARLAQQQAEEKAKREEQERRRQEQVLLDQQKQEEVERKERLRKQQLEREQQLAEIRKLREEAERKRKLEEEKLKQIADRRQPTAERAPTTPAPPADKLGNQGKDDSLAGRYALAIKQIVTQNWLRPESVTSVQCSVRIVQIPGGEVINVNILNPCPADELTKRSLEAAVMKSNPLPYRGFESVFKREIDFQFCYPIERCR